MQTVNRLQGLKMNQLQIQEAPKRFERAAEQHGWAKEDRTITQEFKAIRAAAEAGNQADAQAIYERTRPKGARAAGLGASKPTFKREGNTITIDGGPGTYTIKGPAGAVSGVLEEIEKNPQILKDPKQLEALGRIAAKAGVSFSPNPAAKVEKPAKWEPTTKADALELKRAGKGSGAGPDKTIAGYRKEVARLVTVRERIRKGDKMDQIIKLIDKNARDQLGLAGNETIDEALAKIDDYEKWLRGEIRRLEGGGSDDKDPLSLLGRGSGAGGTVIERQRPKVVSAWSPRPD